MPADTSTPKPAPFKPPPVGGTLLNSALAHLQASDALQLPTGVNRAFILYGDSAKQAVVVGVIIRPDDDPNGWRVAADLGYSKDEQFYVRGTVIKPF